MLIEGNNVKIKVLDWSRTPGFRWITAVDNWSGQKFRSEVVWDAYHKARELEGKLIVDLEGVAGYMTSFLNEAFGGLISRDALDYDEVVNTIEFLPTKLKLWKENADIQLRNSTLSLIEGKSVLETRERFGVNSHAHHES